MKYILAILICLTSATSMAAETSRFAKFKQAGILDCLTCIKAFRWSEQAQNNLYVVATQMKLAMNRLGFQNLDQIKNNKLALNALRETAAVELGKVNHSKNLQEARASMDLLIASCQIFPQELTTKYIAKVKNRGASLEPFTSIGAIN